MNNDAVVNIEALVGDLALIMVLAAIAIVVFKMLKQPVVLGYIVAGFLASPHLDWFPSVVSEKNIEFWGQIGIIVLLFSLGLEFSFKKLLNAGGSAIVTALIVMLGMMATGYVVGETMMGYSMVNSIFLGALLSASSTTIIIKALGDLNMRQRRFVPKVLAVLIVEDLFAVVMLVVLSSIAKTKTVAADEMLISILKLSFFLIMWFTVGVFLLPSLFNRFRRMLTDEMMLIISMGLCFLMVIYSVESGFSMALGAFVMGSILAGTSDAERIEKIVEPVKNLFGAVFFISVGMMVNPSIIAEYWSTIALLCVVVIVGMIIFGTFGMLATGQPLKIAMESGFSLVQIGEFSFIIATLGTSLGVLDASLYPIIVTVSVITTFFTPFFIKKGEPCYNFVVKHIPERWNVLLTGYAANASTSVKSESEELWKAVIKRYLLRTLLYSVVLVMLVVILRTYLIPFFQELLGVAAGNHVGAWASLLILSPFLFALIMPSIKKAEREKLFATSGRVSWVPTIIMSLIGSVLATIFILGMLYGYYSGWVSVLIAAGFILLMLGVLAPVLRHRIRKIEEHFMSNMNQRENRRTGKGNNVVSDLHLAYMTVGYKCPFVGEKLKNANIRQKYGINVVNIQRGQSYHPIPGGEVRIFPGDVLSVIGTEEQIEQLLPLVEANDKNAEAPKQVEIQHFKLSEKSPIAGKTLGEVGLRENYHALLVAVQRKEAKTTTAEGADDEIDDNDNFLTPSPELSFSAGDVIWVVGDETIAKRLR